MPTSNRLDTFIELEEKLSALRVHYGLCPDLQAKEVLEWARFFNKWSRVVGEMGGARSKTNFLKSNKLVMDISSPKPGFAAYEALERAMEEAQNVIQEEIFNFSRPDRVASCS